MSEFRGIVSSLVWRLRADKYNFPSESVRDEEEVMHSPIFSSKQTFGSTILLKSANLWFLFGDCISTLFVGWGQ